MSTGKKNRTTLHKKRTKNQIILTLLGGGLLLVIATFVLIRGGNSAIEQWRQANPEQFTVGEQVYVAECATCHGANGEGQYGADSLKPDSEGLYPAPPHDATGHTWHHDDDLLLSIIVEGQNAPGFHPMPSFGEKLSDVEIEAVLYYIKGWWTDEQRRIQAERTEAIRNQNPSG